MDDGQQTHGPSRRPAPGVLARLAGVKRTRSDVWQHRSAPSATRGQRFSRGEHSVTSRLSLQLETEPLLPHQPETGPCVALRPEQSCAGAPSRGRHANTAAATARVSFSERSPGCLGKEALPAFYTQFRPHSERVNSFHTRSQYYQLLKIDPHSIAFFNLSSKEQIFRRK